MDRFGKMGKNRKMFSSAQNRRHGEVWFQYLQVRSWVLVLLKEGNIFRPKMVFEDLLLLEEKMKMLSKIYKYCLAALSS